MINVLIWSICVETQQKQADIVTPLPPSNTTVILISPDSLITFSAFDFESVSESDLPYEMLIGVDRLLLSQAAKCQ